jgi:peptidoglycan/LPS O-acetylase OafA/YrhL
LFSNLIAEFYIKLFTVVFLFINGGLAFGAAADVWGVPAVLKAICLLPIPAILLAIALPDERKREVTA